MKWLISVSVMFNYVKVTWSENSGFTNNFMQYAISITDDHFSAFWLRSSISIIDTLVIISYLLSKFQVWCFYLWNSMQYPTQLYRFTNSTISDKCGKARHFSQYLKVNAVKKNDQFSLQQ